MFHSDNFKPVEFEGFKKEAVKKENYIFIEI